MNRLTAVKLISALLPLLLAFALGCDAFPPNATPGGTPSPGAQPTGEAPSNGRIIVVDAGHGAPDGGATGPTTGVIESTINLKVAMLLKSELEKLGYTVIMTRTDENALADKKRADMAARLEIMNGSGADAVISVHMNEFTDAAVSGPMVFYHKNSPEAQKLAKAVIDCMCDSTGLPRRHVNPGNYYVIRESTPTAIITECGFLSNPQEEARLQDEAYQALLAAGIAAGIDAYFAALDSPSPDGATASPSPDVSAAQ
ncbi:MAG: N-acetylmuramoyl-L-alanine amidase [Clostridia bacterium]|nr:N-acetylmuramoyl-L-alanine amidase [Clostridia bacterium]